MGMYLSQQSGACEYILKALDVFIDGSSTWFVTEFAEGGDLFDVAASKGASQTEAARYFWQLMNAVAYIHRLHIGHRDISLENILVQDGKAKLMDFAMCVRSHASPETALRYFRAVGKRFYRAPEMYVPASPHVNALVPVASKPNDIILAQVGRDYLCEVRLPLDAEPEKWCNAEVWGYTVCPADVWACAVCFIILAWKSPPWETARLLDYRFAFFHKHGFAKLPWRKLDPPVGEFAMQLLVDMLHVDPSLRPTAKACLDSSWLSATQYESAANLAGK